MDWHDRKKIRDFLKLTKGEQDTLIDRMSTAPSHTYGYERWLHALIKQVSDPKSIVKLTNAYISYCPSYGNTNDAWNIIKYGMPHDNSLRNKISQHKRAYIVRLILLFDDLTEKEEELGLRALSKTKCAYHELYERRYKPTAKIISKLPPVMRLGVLESLLGYSHISYNIMENFKDPDEFRSLMFGTALKYRERVSKVCKKYEELYYFGKEATITIKTNCKNCGEYSLSLTSNMIRTDQGLKNTNIGGRLLSSICMLCGQYNKHTIQVIEDDKYGTK